MSQAIQTVTDTDFEAKVLKANMPVLVDFWAEWCNPCKMIAPILADVAQSYVGKIQVAKLNIDDSPLTPSKFGVRGIPTLLLFKSGNVVATQVGALSKADLIKFIDRNL